MNFLFIKLFLNILLIKFSFFIFGKKYACKTFDSPTPRTCGWDAIIWWVKVVPVLGKPSTNINFLL